MSDKPEEREEVSGSSHALNAQSFTYRRLEMYADTGKDGKRNLVTLESLGGEIH